MSQENLADLKLWMEWKSMERKAADARKVVEERLRVAYGKGTHHEGPYRVKVTVPETVGAVAPVPDGDWYDKPKLNVSKCRGQPWAEIKTGNPSFDVVIEE